MLTPQELTIAFVEAANDYLVVLDRQHRVVFANRAFAKALLDGRDPAGVDFLSLVDAHSAERAAEILAAEELTGRRVELNHPTSDGRLRPVHYSLAPMLIEGIPLTAAVGRDKTQDLELLGEITQLNIELENKQKELTEAYSRLEQQAINDQVTGLYNRHYFFSVAGHFFEESRRYGQPLSCLMMDLDHFKSINDRYGHMFGDHVLRSVSNRLHINSRKSDVLARYGGEEFVLMTPNTDLRTATFLGERIRSSIERETVTLANVSTSMTVSIGICSTELMPEGSLDLLIELADRALYDAKRGGRNRVSTYAGAESGASL